MEEDSNLNALFVEPNAYIQKYDYNCERRGPKKVVFQQPYENAPNFYIREDFKKPKCDCDYRKEEKLHSKPPFSPFSFDLKSFAPLLSMLFKGNSKFNFGDIISILGKQNQNFGGSNFLNILQNKEILSSVANIFKSGKGLSSEKKENQPKAKTTDFQISSYTKVE